MVILNVVKMYILGFFLLISSITKLLLVFSSAKMEVKELAYRTSILVNVPSGTFAGIVSIDGIIGLICSLFILGALW